MFEHVGRLVVTHKKTILVGLFLATLASLALLPGLRFDFTPQALFEQKDEINAFAKSIRAEFGDDTNTLLVVWRGDEPGEVFEPTALADIRRITDWLEASDDAIRVTSLANMHLPRNERTPSGEWSLNLGELVPSVDEVNPALARQVAKWVNEEPLLERVVVSADGSKTTFVVELSEEARQINTLLGVVDRLDAQLAIWEKDLDSHPDLELSGLPSVRVDIITALQKEQMRFLPITGVLMSLLLLWMFRRAAGVLLPITSVLLALAWTMAILVLIDQPINIINSVLPTLMMIIGLSDGIHLLSRASEEATVDRPREEIIVSTVKHMGMACFLTSLTTAIGFGSLVMARTEILQNFGLHTAMGVMLTYVSTLLFIPAMLTWMRPPVRSGLTATSPGLIERGMVYISLYVRTYPKRQVVIGVALIGAAAAASVAWGNIDTRLLETFPEGHKTRVLTHEVEDEFSGVLPLIISIDAEEKGYFEAPENLQKLSTLAQTVKARDPEMVLKTASVYDLLQVFRSAYLNDPSLRDTPFANRAQVKTVLRLYRQDAEADVNRWLDPENRHALVSVRIRDLGAKRGKALVAIVVEEVEALFGEGSAEGVIDAKPPPSAKSPSPPRRRRLPGQRRHDELHLRPHEQPGHGVVPHLRGHDPALPLRAHRPHLHPAQHPAAGRHLGLDGLARHRAEHLDRHHLLHQPRLGRRRHHPLPEPLQRGAQTGVLHQRGRRAHLPRRRPRHRHHLRRAHLRPGRPPDHRLHAHPLLRRALGLHGHRRVGGRPLHSARVLDSIRQRDRVGRAAGFRPGTKTPIKQPTYARPGANVGFLRCVAVRVC